MTLPRMRIVIDNDSPRELDTLTDAQLGDLLFRGNGIYALRMENARMQNFVRRLKDIVDEVEAETIRDFGEDDMVGAVEGFSKRLREGLDKLQ